MNTAPNGMLLVDKAEGWTSHDVVAKSRRALGTRKVGHAGTLDPMATGLLILGAGPATRLLTHLVGLDKTYETVIRLGMATVTDDREGETISCADPGSVRAVAADHEGLAAAVAELTGDIEQSPSAVSAIKVDGVRAYDRVRSGEDVVLQKRPVTVSEFTLGVPRLSEITRADGSSVTVLDIPATIECSSGTYIRALARDLGAALGVGGHLISLRRTRVGPFRTDQAVTTESLATGETTAESLVSPAYIATELFPVFTLTAAQHIDLGHGKRLQLESNQCANAPLVGALSPTGELVGLVSVKNGKTRVVTNFPTADLTENQS